MNSSKLDWVEFVAHGLYQADCREKNVIGTTWMCLRDDVAIEYLKLAQKGFSAWIATERRAAELRAAGNPRAFFAEAQGRDET